MIKLRNYPVKRGIFTILRRFSAPRAGALCTRLPGLQDSQVLHVHQNHTAGVEVIEGLGAVEAQGDRRLRRRRRRWWQLCRQAA